MASGGEDAVSNKQVIFRDYVSGFPQESDMYLASSTVCLKIAEGSNIVIVKNLYLSCDPFIWILMTKHEDNEVFTSLTRGSPIEGFGVAKVVDSGHPEFKK